jgi:CrcB protein
MILRNILLVGLGGGLGSIARYCCQRWITQIWPHAFPWGHFAVNCIGCLLIGLFWGISFRSFEANIQWKALMMSGICGGFTTFSAFTLEGIGLLKEDRMATFFLYVGGSVIAGLALTFVGMTISKQF